MATPQKGTRKKLYSAPALEKGLDILELLSNEVDGMNISQITEHLDKSVGELFRMLIVLEQRGYVETPEGTDRYRLTLKMFGLSNRFPPIKRLNSIATPTMQRLTYDLEQSCHLVIYYEGQGHVVVQQDSPAGRMYSVRLGANVPLLNTCSGHILLAFSDDITRKLMLQKIPSYHGKPKMKEVKEIVSRLQTQGYECIQSSQSPGVKDVGFPIFDYTGRAIAAFSLPYLRNIANPDACTIDEAREKLAIAALEISKNLGYDPDIQE